MAVCRRPRRTIARLLAVSAAILAATVFASPARAAEIGTVPDLTWGVSRAEVDRTVAIMRETRVRWVRMNASWAAVEPNGKGVLDAGALATLDYAVDAVHAAGIRVVMPIADGVPYWASADPAKSDAGGTREWNRYWRPVRFSDYADAVSAIVRRYSARGVHHYEIWNEPNHPRFWPSGPDPAEYAQMLRAGSGAVRAADPTATVLLGGLAGNDYLWLDRLYAAGAQSTFDAVAVHPYTGAVDPTWCWNQAGTSRKAKDAFCGIEEVHASMVAAGDGAKGIWLTEFGWATNTTEYGVTEAVQAEYLGKAFEKLESYPYVKAAFWYTFRNVFWLRDDAANWEASTGLLRSDFSAKPALAAMRGYAQQTGDAPAPTPTPAPTPDAAPTVRLTAPAAGATFTTSLAMRADASDDVGVARVEFLVDGRVVGSDATAPYSLTWSAGKLAFGTRQVSARAVDGGGRTAVAHTTVTRVGKTRAASSTFSTAVLNGSRTVRLQGRVAGTPRGAVVVRVARKRAGALRAWRRVASRRAALDRRGRWSIRLTLAARARYRVSADYRSRPVAVTA